MTPAQLNELLAIINRQSLLAQELSSRIDDKKSPPSTNAKKKLAKIERISATTKMIFISAISSSLKANPNSLALLREYASSFNQVNVAQNSLSQALTTLQSDQAKEEAIQRTLRTVLAGGQSDMNSELGANREKLKQLALKVLDDRKVVAFVQREIILAQRSLNVAEARALADPLASLAITAQMHYLITSDGHKVDMSHPNNWFWGNL